MKLAPLPRDKTKPLVRKANQLTQISVTGKMQQPETSDVDGFFFFIYVSKYIMQIKSWVI
jgi:hypothetical protein